jgi:hypothetical protein
MFINQQEKLSNIPIFFISDVPVKNYESKTFIYSNDEDYYSVWVKTLDSLNFDYFIYLQEDFVLYDNVNNDKINEYVDFLKNNKYHSFVRLLKCGSVGDKKISNTLYDIGENSIDLFAMQPTIWKKDKFVELMNDVKSKIWLENSDYILSMKKNKIFGVYHYENEKKRGLNHFDSTVYPYIATALVRGKWNMSEYPTELGILIEKYKINKLIRGVF